MRDSSAQTYTSLLEIHTVTKQFPGVVALQNASLDIRRGEVHTLLGENGAGKSTLIKILSGVYQPDSGSIKFKGEDVRFASPGDAQRAGISVIYQEPNLIPSMTVAENIFLGNEPMYDLIWPSIDKKRLIDETLQLFDRLNVALDPFALVSELTLSEKQMVAIARALNLSADLIIMDEPTAMINQNETTQLFSVIRSLRAQRMGILYVTHRLEEAMQIGDRATVLRDGRCIRTLAISETSRADLISLIIGRDIDDKYTRQHLVPGPELLRLERVSSPNGVQDISFSLHSGEVLGITGLLGSGGTRVLNTLFGIDPISAGEISIDGRLVAIHSPAEAINYGIGMLPEDRQVQGLVLDMKTIENMSLASLDAFNTGPLIDLNTENNIAQHYAQRLNIRKKDLGRKVRYLSGGTQQKVELSRWLANQCKILLLDEPTRGVDVGARLEFYRLMNELARRGIGLIITSTNLDEILTLADRILILRQGRIVGELDHNTASKNEILTLAGARSTQ